MQNDYKYDDYIDYKSIVDSKDINHNYDKTTTQLINNISLEERKFIIRKLINQIEDTLYNYNLYATKEVIDLVRDELPYNIKPVEVPEGFLPNPKNVYLIRREYLKGYNIYDEF